MNREQATKLLKEIDEECRDIRGSSILLMGPNETNILSHGYQVHIKMKADWKRLKCLQTIAEQYGYDVKNDPENSLVIVYRSMERKKAEEQAKGPTPTGYA